MKIAVLAAVMAQILVIGVAHAGGPVRVPEPTSLALLSVGAAAAAAGVWWRNRK